MYIEYLSIINIFSITFYHITRKINLKNKTIFYIDKTFSSNCLILLLKKLYNINFECINFKLIEIKDRRKELIRLRIFRKDLIELKKNIIDNNKIFEKIKNDKELKLFYIYLNKAISDGHFVMNPESLVRAVFIIQVIFWHSNKNDLSSNIDFFIGKRIWFNELSKYANNYNINLISVPQIKKFYRKKNFYFFYIGRLNFPFLFYLYNIFKKTINFKNPFIKFDITNSKIYSHFRGHLNFKNDGMNSDLFFLLNSNLNSNDMICEYNNDNQFKLLKSNNYSVINEKLIFLNKTTIKNKKFNIDKKNLSNLDYNFIKKNLEEYNQRKRSSYLFCKSNNIKIFLTWDKYYKNHIAQCEAMLELNGIFAVWQHAFEGTISSSTQLCTDIYFSNFPNNLYFNHNSKIKYFVETGFLMDYQIKLLKKQANILRNKILNNGASYIIAVFDENSNQYQRWHTGHPLQAENYEIILKELLKNPKIGVIFKPKNAKTLRDRIGKVNEILLEAENTGRCFVYDDFTDNFTSAPPILAGLSSDICIHSHLSAGTAAIECALANIPTLLIDREGSPENLLYNLYDEKIIFNNWHEVISKINYNLNSDKKNEDLGIWPEKFLNSLDNFRDGKAAYRMGEYLNNMINLSHQNKSREDVMSIASKTYKEKYGIDKITYIN